MSDTFDTGKLPSTKYTLPETLLFTTTCLGDVLFWMSVDERETNGTTTAVVVDAGTVVATVLNVDVDDVVVAILETGNTTTEDDVVVAATVVDETTVETVEEEEPAPSPGCESAQPDIATMPIQVIKMAERSVFTVHV